MPHERGFDHGLHGHGKPDRQLCNLYLWSYHQNLCKFLQYTGTITESDLPRNIAISHDYVDLFSLKKEEMACNQSDSFDFRYRCTGRFDRNFDNVK